MKARKVFLVVVTLIAAAGLGYWIAASAASPQATTDTYLPIIVSDNHLVTPTPTITNNPTATRTRTPTPTSTGRTRTPTSTSTPTNTRTATLTGTPSTPSTGPIIVDHRHTDISQIPEYWINEAKKLTIHYAHTSHGSQVLDGLVWLEGQDANYNIDIFYGDTVALPDDTSAMRFYDGNNYGGDNYITPDMYWESQDGIDHTNSVAATGLFDLSTWTWCGQASYYDSTQIQTYLTTLAGFETAHPGMRYIYFTGHSDGGSSELDTNNDAIRQYATANNKVLFDFQDIERYDPDGGGPYDNNGDGTCTWCKDYCDNHPGYCDSLPDSCAHTDDPAEARLFCKLKAQAWWWLMARLAGWDGTPAR